MPERRISEGNIRWTDKWDKRLFGCAEILSFDVWWNFSSLESGSGQSSGKSMPSQTLVIQILTLDS